MTIEAALEGAHDNVKVLEALKIFNEGRNGGIHARHRLEEAMSTSDFHTRLMDGFKIGAVELMKSATREWEPIAAKALVPDFRKVHMRDFFGGLTLQLVPEGSEYPLETLEETSLEIGVSKYGSGVKFTYEMWKNRDFSSLVNIPQLFANAAIDAENRNVFGLLLNAQGTPSSFFKGPGAGTGALNAETLEAAYVAQTQRKRLDKKSAVDLTDLYLVVPAGLALTAERLVNAERVERTVGDLKTTEANPFRGRIKILVSQTLTDLGATAGTWFLLPGAQSKNPALGIAFLNGGEAPDMRVLNNQGQNLSGGQVIFEEGSFLDDTIHYRVRHVTGSALLMDSAAYGSTGAA